MLKIKSFMVIGGDLRQLYLAESLKNEGYEVHIFGFDKFKGESTFDIRSELEDGLGADSVILPLPMIFEGENLNLPMSQNVLSMRELFSKLDGQKVFAGKVPSHATDTAGEYGIEIIDYFIREEMAILNAVPTAEGAVQIAMEEMATTLWGSRALVLGYGKIGKVLSKMLTSFGARVDVTARKYQDLAWIKAMNMRALTYEDMGSRLHLYDVIFNTVPSRILGKERLPRITKECLLIDLASKPGGFDFEAANELGLKSIWALSLPGKVAPKTASEIEKETIFNILKEME